MELKYHRQPLTGHTLASSNCTFMELKCETYNVYRRESAAF